MSTTAATIAVPDGYALVERIGSGGYGEVWKAIAPGGVEKAIKIVYGHYREDCAERELKSLERIRSVRHPFLLSIERFDIVMGRLVIVTELADSSLSECWSRHHAIGECGLPRDPLLSYLWDAADALDCLAERHSLQHLDVKPENILIVGDHAKVADFGLVKELTSRTLNSMMGGMTPVYSAPEIFDDDPSPQSDQYSLAIVYQQMLTGTLPFAGRTPAQLAKQHTQAAPNLGPLSAVDQGIVRKALEKTPSLRFASCRDFVSALRNGRKPSATVTSARTKSGASPPIPQSEETKSTASLCTQRISGFAEAALALPQTSTRDSDQLVSAWTPSRKPSVRSCPNVSPTIEDIVSPDDEDAVDTAPIPTLVIGIGGIGIEMLTQISRCVGDKYACGATRPPISLLAVDVDGGALRTISANGAAAIETVQLSLRKAKHYRDSTQDLLRWVSRRWLYNIPRSLLTNGYRPLARIALVDHADEMLRNLHTRLQQLVPPSSPSRNLRTIVLAGMSGGTGSGIAIDVAQAVRSLCNELAISESVHAVLASTFHVESSDLLAASNMFAMLAELTHAQSYGNVGCSTPRGSASRFERRERPFDSLHAVAIPPRGKCEQRAATYASVANFVGYQIATNRSLKRPIDGDDASFGTFTCIDLDQVFNEWQTHARNRLLGDVVGVWSRSPDIQEGERISTLSPIPRSALAASVARRMMAESTSLVTGDGVARDRLVARIAAHTDEVLASLVELYREPSREAAQDERDARALNIGECVAARFCEQLRQTATRTSASELDSLLQQEVQRSWKDCSIAESEQMASSVEAMLDARLFNCGYRRRITILQSKEQQLAGFVQAIVAKLPTTQVKAAPDRQSMLLAEGSGIAPLHLAGRLAESYPEIHDAAARLHTRDDIDWHGVFSS